MVDRSMEGPAPTTSLPLIIVPPSCAHSTPRSQSDSSAFRFESVNRVAAVVSCKAFAVAVPLIGLQYCVLNLSRWHVLVFVCLQAVLLGSASA